MRGNFEFHFLIYRAATLPTMNRIIETLWMQFGPFMRTIYSRTDTRGLIDRHQEAMAAIAAQDATALYTAISEDIADGMHVIEAGASDSNLSPQPMHALIPVADKQTERARTQSGGGEEV